MRLTALLLCGALTLAACGGGGSPTRSDADRVRDTLSAFAQASAKHELVGLRGVYGRIEGRRVAVSAAPAASLASAVPGAESVGVSRAFRNSPRRGRRGWAPFPSPMQ